MTSITKLISVSVFSLLLAVASGGAFWWLLSGVEKVRLETGNFEAKISVLTKERELAVLSERVLGEFSLSLERLGNFLVSRERPVEFIEKLEELAEASKNILVLEIDESRSTNEWLMFRVTVNGSETGVLKYVKLLELLPHEIKIEDLTFQRISPASAGIPRDKSKTGVLPNSQIFFVIRVRAS